MARSRLAPAAGVLAAIAIALVGCGWKSDLDRGRASQPGIDLGPRDGGGRPTPGPMNCLIAPGVPERGQLDIALLQDGSGSMLESGAGALKFELVATALERVLTSPESAGIELSLTFFPLVVAQPVQLCVNDDQCGEGTACASNLCAFTGQACDPEMAQTCVDVDGQPDAAGCQSFGRCELSRAECDPALPGAGCPGSPVERCDAVQACEQENLCLTVQYETPALEFAPLPGAGHAVVDEVLRYDYRGTTPIEQALTGVLEQARLRRRARPGVKVVALLATDGLPTFCALTLRSQERIVQGVVDVAAAGRDDGIETYVVGVFRENQAEEAQLNLSRIAAAGGTGDAVIVSENTRGADLLTAGFAEVRDRAAGCVFDIPAEARAELDPETLVVRRVGGGGGTLTRLADRGLCDTESDGRGYTLEEPAMPGTPPGFVDLCPDTCVALRESGGRIEMRAGCE